MTAGGMVPIMIAAAKARRLREEEENMATYNKEDLEGWEFKIIRSAGGRFRNYERVKELCLEEAKAGWELVEKFDDSRIRFKRRVEQRSSDAHREIDPYRTHVGINESSIAAIVLGAIFALMAGVLLFTKALHSDHRGEAGGEIFLPLILMLIIAIAIAAVVAARYRR